MNEVSDAIEVRVSAPLGNECWRFLLTAARPGWRTLDVGCGDGDLMVAMANLGCEVVGIDVDPGRVATCRGRGLEVHLGRAESLPFPDGSFDCVTSSVALPYVDERKAVAEWYRVLRPGGFAQVTGHGVGYGLHYMRGPDLWKRIYGARMLLNTGCYELTGRRLPGFLGDTMCQRAGRLLSTCAALGLMVDDELVVGTVAGAPIFLGHRMRKPA